MNKLDSQKLSVEMVSFSFGPTDSGRIALISCALAMAGALPAPCLGAELARSALLNREGSAWHPALLRWEQTKADETTSWARLTHRQVFIEGPESFRFNFSFMGRLEQAACKVGAQIWPAQVYWAHFEACLANWDIWPQPDARAWMERAVLEAQDEAGAAGTEAHILEGVRRL